MKSQSDITRWCFCSWPMDSHVLAHEELKCATQRSFHCGAIDFSVALPCMTVSNFKERAASVDWKIQRCAGDQIFIVHVSAMDPGLTAADPARPLRRRNSHTSKKRTDRNLDSFRKIGHTELFVERNNFNFGGWIFISQKSACRVGTIPRVGDRQAD